MKSHKFIMNEQERHYETYQNRRIRCRAGL